MRRYTVLLLALVALTGCSLFNHLEVKSLAVSAEKPSNVAVYLSVDNGDDPVTGLTEKDFHIFENGQPIDPAQSGETLLDRASVSVYRTVLLVDMSNATHRDALAHAASGFVANVRRTQAVTVFAFDGGTDIRLAGEFPRLGGTDDAPTTDVVPGLASFATHDPSRDLNSAILSALDQLDARLMTVKKPVRVGTLVVYTEGPDLAGRTSNEKLDEALSKTEHQVVAVGLGDDTGDFRLKSVGRNGVLRAPSADALGPTFSDAGTRVSTAYDKYYLVSYCSPARAGKRALRVEVQTADKDGNEVKGSIDGEFDATGFGPGCDPKTIPRFVIHASSGDTDTAPEPEKHEPAKPAKPRHEPEKKPAPAGDQKPPDGDNAIVPPPSKPGYAPTPP